MDENWMLPKEALKWIEDHIPKGSTIIEFGSGHGSLRLAKRYDVHSVEHDAAWLGLAPVTYLHAPIVPNPTSSENSELGWYDPDMLQGRLPRYANLLIIDGPPEKFGRSGLIGNIDLIPKGIKILLDDYNRSKEKKLAEALLSAGWVNKEVHISNQVCNDGSHRKFCILYPKWNPFRKISHWVHRIFFR